MDRRGRSALWRNLAGLDDIGAAQVGAAFTTTDRLLLGYLAFVGVAATLYQPHPARTVAALVAVALVHAGIAAAAARSPAMRLAHDFWPFPDVVFLFSVSGPVIAAANPLRFDALMAAADVRLLGPIPDAWRHLLGRPAWLVDLASVAYMSYYVLPLGIGIALYAADRRREFEEVSVAVVATLVASYAGYFLFPTSGPRVPASLASSALGGGAVSEAVRAFVAAGEANVLDAFPSGHTALGLVSAWLGWRFLPRARAVLALAAAGIVFATVYLSYHYVVDVLAGALLALAVPRLARWLSAVLGPAPRAAAHR
jgi:membrane-associated phospholipid phosphatase